jgi:thiamine biosynthesis protein ThiI
MADVSAQSILLMVRIGPEVATKARRTRKRFLRQLGKNITDAIASAGSEHEIDIRWSRLLVATQDRSAIRRVASVFGVSSLSEVEARIPADLEQIVGVAESVYRERVRGKAFAVRARRVGRYPFSSQEIKVEVGAALNAVGTVDLKNPDVVVTVEVRDGEAFLHSSRVQGVGGLPLGVQGKAVCLLSGGFDSAVAAWLMLKRGISLDYVFCNVAGDAYERSVLSVAKILSDEWSFGDQPRAHVVDFEAVVKQLRNSVRPRYWQVVLKRLMYRAAEMVALQLGAEAIVTGESLGQVSSQTLGNLRAIDGVAGLPVFRPLVGWDKSEIMAKAEWIGTAAVSAHILEHCAIVPDHPVTHASPRAAQAEEARVDLGILTKAVSDRKVIDLRALAAVDLVRPYIFASEVPENAVVLDCREPHHFRVWHYTNAERWDIHELGRRFRELDKSRTYILYCTHGVQTAYLAEVMQRHGYDVYSFKGGVRAIMRYTQARTSSSFDGTVAVGP